MSKDWEQGVRRVRNLVTFLTAFLLTLLASAAIGEESDIYHLGSAGIVKADLSPVLYLCEGSDPCTSESTAAITLTALPSTIDYRWEDLPDAAAGSDIYYAIVWTLNGDAYVYAWPNQTRTPQSVISAITHRVSPSTPLNLAIGATFPSIGSTVHNLSSDPTGSTATFTMWDRSRVAVLDDVAASCSDVDSHTDGTWSMTCEHAWTAIETATAGSYTGRFTITLPGGEIVGSPPSPNELKIVIHR